MSAPATAVVAPGLEPRGASRLVALDWLRGLVMVMMAVDHSSGEFNKGRLMLDGVFLWHPGTPLPTAQFLTRWMTHLCAPTFVFLAGTSIALSIARRAARGESAASIDRHLLVRGLTIVAFEIVPSFFWMPPGKFLLQVLYAIGTSYLFMIPLRRLAAPLLAVLAVTILLFGEAIVRAFGWGIPESTPLLAALLLVPGPHGSFIVAYPTLYWLAIMLLGWLFGKYLERRGSPRSATVAGVGAILLVTFVLVRGENAYGNMGLLREGLALTQWLHVSKYPPSLSFVTLELGIGALVLASFLELERRGWRFEFLAVLGRTPMLFYLLHIPILALAAEALGVAQSLGLVATYSFAAVTSCILYPVCKRYGRFKLAHPNGLARYI